MANQPLDPKEQAVFLPDLHTYPDRLTPEDLKKPFVVRESMISLLQLVHQQMKFKKALYVAGPSGVGKSVALYFVVCCALALEWVVIYIVRLNI